MKLDNYVAEPVVEDPEGANGVTMGQDGSMQVFNSSTNKMCIRDRLCSARASDEISTSGRSRAPYP